MNSLRRFRYPNAPTGDVVDTYFGTEVPDPYRWLEEPNSEATRAFVKAQNELTFNYLSASPYRHILNRRLTAMWDHPHPGVPSRQGKGRLFFSYNDGLQNQSLLYWQDGLEGRRQLLLDPNTLSDDGTTAVTTEFPNKDGTLLAYGLSHSGSDWQEIHIRQVETGQELEDVIHWARFSGVAWAADSSGFFYSRYPDPTTRRDAPPSTHNQVFWHTLGTSQAEDRLIYARPDAPDLGFYPFFSDDGRYLFLEVWQGTDVRNRFYYRPTTDSGDFIRLLDQADARYELAGNNGSVLYFMTDLEAPQGRVVAIDLQQPDHDQWQEIVAERPEDVIVTARLVHKRLVVNVMRDAQHRLLIYDLSGRQIKEIPLPEIGTVTALHGRQQDDDFFFGFESYLQPACIYRYDLVADQLQTFSQTQMSIDSNKYSTSQVFYTSSDGTRVPMFILHRRDLELNGQNPTLLYGYGGFNISQTPEFGAWRMLWLELGGVMAIANLRGGGEYGAAWHEAGMLSQKQNVFDDFIAAAEWLVEEKYTSREKLAIWGRSNGGLLVAAVMLQRPELFGAVICGVPVTDMLRYHHFTAGRYWTPEYGNAQENEEHFRFLFAYSPLHNVKPAAYPPLLTYTADTDDRVVPSHSLKFMAAIQALDKGHNPLLVRLETSAGHGLGKPTAKLIAEYADIITFLVEELGLNAPPGYEVNDEHPH